MNQGIVRLLFALLNMMGVAGVGTCLAGRIKTGVIQIILSLGFFGLTLIGLFRFYYLTKDDTDGSMLNWYISMLRGDYTLDGDSLACLGLMVLAIGCFGLNLLWSLTTTRPVSTVIPPPLPQTRS
ncbi:MAG: hypothetical protein ACFCUX_04365 [Candidatus Methylacidiphilales bacterium]